MTVSIRKRVDDDRTWIIGTVLGSGVEFIVSRNRKLYPCELDGFVTENESGEPVGLVTYEIVGDQCEIVTIDAFNQWQGIGTLLLEPVKEAARAAGCTRLWLLTTNDNIEAIRFYQKRGFTIAAVHLNEIKEYRTIKPQIPEIGLFGIPMRDMIEFEMAL
jgi:GNAT superfamily N-acetyltransferase